jgi:hypothetical protein
VSDQRQRIREACGRVEALLKVNWEKYPELNDRGRPAQMTTRRHKRNRPVADGADKHVNRAEGDAAEKDWLTQWEAENDR